MDSILSEIVAFRDERDWAQFHTPKNLAAALAIEASELQEQMLWRDNDEVAHRRTAGPCRCRLEADVPRRARALR